MCQLHAALLLTLYVLPQLCEAEQQLSQLSTHIDALMVGFAVQALQSAGDPGRQQAIHMQALAEQQKVSSWGGSGGSSHHLA
jgi:hypothetical protein